MKKKRIIFEISEQSHDELESLKKRLNVRTNSELIRTSLGLLDLITQYEEKGYKTKCVNDSESVTIVLPKF